MGDPENDYPSRDSNKGFHVHCIIEKRRPMISGDLNPTLIRHFYDASIGRLHYIVRKNNKVLILKTKYNLVILNRLSYIDLMKNRDYSTGS